METLEKTTVGELVAKDFRTVTLFSKYGIDFCCSGNITLEAICEENKLNTNDLLNQIETILNTETNSKVDFNAWPIDLLAEYIEKKHHHYVAQKTKILLPFLNQICNVHSEKHSELLEIKELFTNCSEEMSEHIQTEETVLFPYIKNLVNALIVDELIMRPNFETVENPIELLMAEHIAESIRFKEIANLSNNFTPPADACSTYKVTFDLLKEFQQDMAKHIFLENNILFPKAIQLEKDYASQFS